MQSQILKYRVNQYLFKLLILFCFLILFYSNTLSNEFTMDDHALISGSYLTRNLKLLPQVFKQPIFGVGCFYRPLSQAFLMLEYFLFKLNTFGYHLVNILLHFINCLLFFRLLNLLFGNYALSFLSTALFAVHPIHNTIINQCGASDVLLVSIFMLLSLLNFIEFLSSSESKHCYLSMSFFIIALFFRETAMLFPFYLLCALFFMKKNTTIKNYVFLILPFLICSLTYFLFRLFFFGLKGAILNEFTKSFDILNYISGFLHLILIYICSLIIPKGIVWIWSIPAQGEFFDIAVIVFVLILSVVIYIAIKYWKKSVESFATFWFLIGAFSTILIISSRYSFGLTLEPQWLYFSSIGFFLFVSIFLLKLKKYINSKLWLFLIVSILLFYGSEARAYNYLWRNSETYFKYWLRESPNNIARLNLANIYSSKERYREAEFLYRETLSHSFLKKGDKFFFSRIQVCIIYNNLGTMYYKQGRLNDALRMFNKAIEINADNSIAHSNRADVFLSYNQSDKAIVDYEKVTEKDPYNLKAHYNLAILYARFNKQDKALEEYFKAVAIDKNCFKGN